MTTTTHGTAGFQADLWDARAADWAAHERQYRPLYDEALRVMGAGPGSALLDAGCGSGVFLRAAADHGAEVSGLDASAAMIEIARSRVPEADLRIGDLQFLPYDADSFDAVTSFSSFWYAADPIEALREAGRVAKPGAPVLTLVFGRPERCEVGPMLGALAALAPASPPGAAAKGKFDLHEPGVLEQMATAAGLAPQAAANLELVLEFADDAALVREMMSPGPVVLAVRSSGEEAVRSAILRSLAPFRTPAGGYRLRNEFRYLVASAG